MGTGGSPWKNIKRKTRALVTCHDWSSSPNPLPDTKYHSQQSGSSTEWYVSLAVLPLSWPLGAISFPRVWPEVSLWMGVVTGCHIDEKL